MTRLRFEADPSPADAALVRAAETAPENPFLTSAFAEAQRRMGREIALLSLRNEANWVSCCYAGVKRGGLRVTVQIFSLPAMGADSDFGDGLTRFCRSVGADLAIVDSFGSRVHGVPPLPGEVTRRSRLEHVWGLQGADLWGGLSANHRRNVTRARKSGIVMVAAEGRSGLRTHMSLTDASLARREQRGEQVETEGAHESGWGALLDTGAGTLFQAQREGEVLSSILVLKAREGAYYHSAGTSPEGMRLGASQLLVFEVASRLAAEGLSVFNLGGAEPSSEGLYRFKVGFGTAPQPLEAASYRMSGTVRRGILWLADSVRGKLRPEVRDPS